MPRRKIFRKHRLAPIAIGDFLQNLLTKMGGCPGRDRLSLLWENWNEVLGPELCQQAQPAAIQGRNLVLQAENALQIQELQFCVPEMLLRINQYLGAEYFKSIHFSICARGKKCRGRPSRQNYSEAPRASGACLPKTHVQGKYLKDMDKNSPVAKCYAAFAKGQ